MHASPNKMRTIVFDTSTIISVATNDLLWTLHHLKKQFKGRFIISQEVKREIIDTPFNSKRYKLEALMIKDHLGIGHLTLYTTPQIREKAQYILELSNNIYFAKKTNIKILHLAEIESLVTAVELKSQAYCVDERTMRLIVEDPLLLQKLLKDKLHTQININSENLREFSDYVNGLKIIRSIELMIIAYKMRILDKYITDKSFHPELKHDLLDGLLWGLKLRGASITEREIQKVLSLKNF